jgi:prophage antirepressor-like protein
MTPQTQLRVNEVFEGKGIRAIEYKGEMWIPLLDISEAWGLDRNTTTKIINRNPDIFDGLSTVMNITGDVTSPSDNIGNALKCVNEQGIYVLALKVSAGRIKNKDVKKKIIRFQKWVPELIQQFRRGDLISLTTIRKPVEVISEQFDIADSVVKRTGMDKSQAHAYATILAGDQMGVDLTCYAAAIKAQSKQLLITDGCKPVDQADFDSHFSLKYIANILKLSEDKTRNILESKNILCYKNQRWHLTTYGEQYGKAFKVQIGYPYRSIQQVWIRYNPELIKLLRLEYHIESTKVE